MLLLCSKLTDTSSVWVSPIYTVLKFETKSEISDAWHGVCKEIAFLAFTLRFCNSDLLILSCVLNLMLNQTGYSGYSRGLTLSDYKIHRCRERDFLKKVHESMDKGGKVINYLEGY